jgi:hypothetical protein
MNATLNLEIHFHQQDHASVFLESTASGDDQEWVGGNHARW